MGDWLGLVIGNSRLHWAWFKNDLLDSVWDTDHLAVAVDSVAALVRILPQRYRSIAREQSQHLPIYLASVVPGQTKLWQNYPLKKVLAIANFPLQGTYPSLGIDRVLTVCGAGETYGYPALVIDAGTALTFTGVDEQKTLVGGAILPGLGLQLRSLNRQTAALPQIELVDKLPPRWALETEEAIASGTIYTLVAGIHSYIEDWLTRYRYPNSQIIFTGGDSFLLFQHYSYLFPQIAKQVINDQKLIFWGLKVAKNLI